MNIVQKYIVNKLVKERKNDINLGVIMNSVYEYNSRISKILDNIDILRRRGDDVSIFERKLKNIKISTSKGMNTVAMSDGRAAQAMMSDMYYIEALKQLSELLDEITECINLSNIHFKCEDIKNKLSNDDITTDELCSLVLQLIDDVANIKHDFDTSTDLIEEVYKTAYEVIKIELLKHGKSKLLEYINKYDKGIEFINDCIREELEKFDLNDLKNKDINDRLNEILKDRLNYADERLIMMILLKSDKRVFTYLQDRICKLVDSIKEANRDIHTANDDRNRLYDENVRISEKKKKNKKQKITSIFFVTFLTLSTLYNKSSETTLNKFTTYEYKNTKATYSTVSGLENSSTELVYNPSDNTVILREYGEVSSSGQRILTTYDMSDIDLDSIEDYTQYDLSSLSGDTELIDYDETQESKSSYMIVDKTNYSDEPFSSTFDEAKYKKRVTIQVGLVSMVVLLNLIKLILIVNEDNKLKKEKKKNQEKIGELSTQISAYVAEREEAEKLYQELRKELSDKEILILATNELKKKNRKSKSNKSIRSEKLEDIIDSVDTFLQLTGLSSKEEALKQIDYINKLIEDEEKRVWNESDSGKSPKKKGQVSGMLL